MSSKDTAIANGEKPTSVENGSILFCNVCEKRGMFLPGVHYSTINGKKKNVAQISCVMGGGMKCKQIEGKRTRNDIFTSKEKRQCYRHHYC